MTLGCVVDNCSSRVHARGCCDTHYRRLRLYGDPNHLERKYGSRYIDADGYVVVYVGDGRGKREHIVIAEKALGKPLPPRAVVHHVDENPANNLPSNLVICPNRSYHNLIHQRMRALAACGHVDWLKCGYCKQYDDPKNLRNCGTPRQTPRHQYCAAEYDRKHRSTR